MGGIFEVRGEDGDAIILLNLLDDLEYRTYSNMGRAAGSRRRARPRRSSRRNMKI